MPTICCWLEAAIWVAACAASAMLSASRCTDSPAWADCNTPASTALLPCSVAITAALVAFWISLRQVRLLGQGVHGGDNLSDGLALFAQSPDTLSNRFHLLSDPVHCLDGFLDRFLAVLGDLRRLLRALRNIFRLLIGELCCLFHLFHGRGGLADRRGGLRRPGGDLICRCHNFTCGRSEDVDGLLDFQICDAEFVAHSFEGDPQAVLLRSGLHFHRQVP